MFKLVFKGMKEDNSVCVCARACIIDRENEHII